MLQSEIAYVSLRLYQPIASSTITNIACEDCCADYIAS